VFRARLILALADGSTYREIARSLKTSLPNIARWKMPFERDGLAGLEGRHQGSKPRAATPTVQARVIRRVQQKPGDGSTHWSCRKLASELALSKSTVQRILAQAQLKPHRLERYMASNDPDFDNKAADIIGLYLHPPEHAAVFCLDEKTAIQALDRLDPVFVVAGASGTRSRTPIASERQAIANGFAATNRSVDIRHNRHTNRRPNQTSGPAGTGCCRSRFRAPSLVLGGCLFEAFQGRQPANRFSSLLLRDA
jgi:transposase